MSDLWNNCSNLKWIRWYQPWFPINKFTRYNKNIYSLWPIGSRTFFMYRSREDWATKLKMTWPFQFFSNNSEFGAFDLFSNFDGFNAAKLQNLPIFLHTIDLNPKEKLTCHRHGSSYWTWKVVFFENKFFPWSFCVIFISSELNVIFPTYDLLLVLEVETVVH